MAVAVKEQTYLKTQLGTDPEVQLYSLVTTQSVSFVAGIKQLAHNGTGSKGEDLSDNTAGCVRGTAALRRHNTTSYDRQG